MSLLFRSQLNFSKSGGELAFSTQHLARIVVDLLWIFEEGPRRTSMLATLLTQLLGKVAEAMLMHAKTCNLPWWLSSSQVCW